MPLGGRARGALMVAAAGVLFSTLGLGVRLIEHASAFQIVFYRGLFQTAVVAALVVRRRRAGGSGGRSVRMDGNGWVAAMALAVAYNGMVIALTLASVATVMFTLATAPLLAGLLAFAVLGERMRPRTWIAIGIALCGVLLMTLGERGVDHTLGRLAAGAAVAGYAVFTVALRRAGERDMLPTIALSGLLSSLLSCFALDGLSMSPRDLALCFYLGGVSLSLGLMLFAAGARHLTAAELPLLAMTEFVLAPLWVWAFLGETVPASTLVGGSVMLVAVLLQARGAVVESSP